LQGFGLGGEEKGQDRSSQFQSLECQQLNWVQSQLEKKRHWGEVTTPYEETDMAFKDYELEIPQEYRADYPFIYNVSFSVGQGGCYNLREDVLLVQYFLKMIWARSEIRPAGRDLKLDGLMGNTTRRWIVGYQRGENLPGEPRYMGDDGRVDRAHGGVFAPQTGRAWTIVCMNIDFNRLYPEYYLWLTGPGVPDLLRYALSAPWPSS
jgi:hypothetical protein